MPSARRDRYEKLRSDHRKRRDHWIAASTTGEGARVAADRPRRRNAWFAAAAVAAALVVVSVAGAVWVMRRSTPAVEPVRSELMINETLTPALFGSVALSPDGKQLLMLVGPAGKPSIAIRDLVSAETRVLTGTEGAIFPFWSPDSQRIGFFSGGKLKAIGAGGGSVQTLCDAAQGRGGSWSPNGVIIFAPDIFSPIYKVSENGGTPVAVTRLLATNVLHRMPAFLPGGKTFLFIARERNGGDTLCAGSVDGSIQKAVVNEASNSAYARGRLFFVSDGNLVSQPFDTVKLEVSGTLMPVADHVEYFKVRSVGSFSVTPTKLVYVSEASPVSEIVVHDSNGRIVDIHAGAAPYRILDVSPDGRLAAVAITERSNQGDVWIVHLDSGAKSRLTFAGGDALSAAFAPDSTRVAVSSGYFGRTVSVVVHSLVSGQVHRIMDCSAACLLTGWSSDGKYLVADTQDFKTGFDIERIDVLTGAITQVVHGPADELAPALSPNRKWLAYVSAESGTPEIYVTSFPSGEGKWQATQEGGTAPRWARDGKQLFYVKSNRVMAMGFREGAIPQFGTPTALSVTVVADRIFVNSSASYGVTPDGRFITTRPVGDLRPVIHLVTNWNETLAH